MAGVDGCVRYIGRHGGRLGAACAVGWWLMWVDERVVRVRSRWRRGGLQVSGARFMVTFMRCIVECLGQREGVAGRGLGTLTCVIGTVDRFWLQVLCRSWVCCQCLKV